MRLDLINFIYEQMKFSLKTFGPGGRDNGIIDHIKKELKEIEAAPGDLEEWIDVIILAIDGAWRAGHKPEFIAAKLVEKHHKNRSRSWPDWRTAEPGKAIEHLRKCTCPGATDGGYMRDINCPSHGDDKRGGGR